MANTPVPDDRAMLAALEKLKAYSSYKAKQVQSAGGGPSPVEDALRTIETWADDPDDEGKAWGQNKRLEADQKIQGADKWRDQVRKDDQDAAKEADFRSKLDMPKVKDALKQQLDDYQGAIKQKADAGEPGFKGKLAEVKTQNADAKGFIDRDMEKAMDLTARKNAEQRQQHKLIAALMEKRGAEGKQWKAEYGDQPAKFGAGQRADVQSALDVVNQWAAGKSAELEPFGPKVAVYLDSLKKVQNWSSGLKPQVNAQGRALMNAKASGKAGVADTRATMSHVEAFQMSLEGDANRNTDAFRAWTNRNNELAKQWINSDSPKHRQWAQDWMNTQKPGKC